MRRRYRKRSLWTWLLPLAVVALVALEGCSGLRTQFERWVERTFGNVTARQEYAWNLSEEVRSRWDTAYQRAIYGDSLWVDPPLLEFILPTDSSLLFSAHTWHLRPRPGRVLDIAIKGIDDGPPPLLFAELYRYGQDPLTDIPLVSWDTATRQLSYDTGEENENLLFVVQAAPGNEQAYQVSMRTRPALLFPVADRDYRAIRSFWGDRRDGGRRRHEGNDIFAPRGTPLLAVADGRISSVRNGGLGGKSVWLRDGRRGWSYYYAHLDSQLVRRGQYVRRGDTVGLVGNTGNARTTPPHLHFGIYAGSARDPYPYLLPADPAPEPPRAAPGEVRQVPDRGVHYLRRAPRSEGDNVRRRLENGAPLQELSTVGRFHRVVTREGEVGYVNLD